jgi:hypothetical protein
MGIYGKRPHFLRGNLCWQLRSRVLPADQLLGVEDPAVLPDVSPLGLVAVYERPNIADGVPRHMYLADWLPTRSQDASGQVDVLFFVVIVVREARGRAVAAVTIFVFLFGTEAKKSQGTLKLKDRLFEHACTFLLRSKKSLFSGKEFYREDSYLGKQ